MSVEKIVQTLVLVHTHPKILLGMKKKGFGKGRWNGFGGKVESGETIEEAAYREMLEESGVVVSKLEKMGVIEFRFRGKPFFVEMHVFRTSSFEGTPKESDEMRPEWFDINAMPYEEMWSADRFWFPVFLEGAPFTAKVFFDENDQVTEHSIKKHYQFSFL